MMSVLVLIFPGQYWPDIAPTVYVDAGALMKATKRWALRKIAVPSLSVPDRQFDRFQARAGAVVEDDSGVALTKNAVKW